MSTHSIVSRNRIEFYFRNNPELLRATLHEMFSGAAVLGAVFQQMFWEKLHHVSRPLVVFTLGFVTEAQQSARSNGRLISVVALESKR